MQNIFKGVNRFTVFQGYFCPLTFQNMMPSKPAVGVQDFRSIVQEGYKYVDKTKYIHQLTNQAKAVFLSRPRRFGKSLTISILHELFKGNRDLFKGLWIEDQWDWTMDCPVISISFTSIGFQTLGLERALEQELNQIAASKGITFHTDGIASRFKELIQQLGRQNNVVVLIDEYDAPIIQYLGKEIETAYRNRDLLKGFFAVLKDTDQYLKFVFLTGVSKFSKVGIFSGLNNLFDITLHPAYATMFGYTQSELETNFAADIKQLASRMDMTVAELTDKMRVWYNGYRFEETAETVYNPVSVNTFFATGKFQNFWFSTGTPTFLVNLLKQEGIYDLQFDNIKPSGFDTFELDNLKPVSILFQTGYLTIRSATEEGLLHLDYPNQEVRDAMLESLIEGFVGVDAERSTALVIKLRNAFFDDDIEQVIRLLSGVFANLPYPLHEKYPEKFYHAAIHLLFTYMGLRIHSEAYTSDGRLDALVETNDRLYILEFKLDQSAQVALDQIRQKKYHQAVLHHGKPVTGIGINFSSQHRNIDDWAFEVLA